MTYTMEFYLTVKRNAMKFSDTWTVLATFFFCCPDQGILHKMGFNLALWFQRVKSPLWQGSVAADMVVEQGAEGSDLGSQFPQSELEMIQNFELSKPDLVTHFLKKGLSHTYPDRVNTWLPSIHVTETWGGITLKPWHGRNWTTLYRVK